MNIDLEGWRDRIQNMLDVQKDLQLEEMRMTFNRRDLIELRLIINSLEDYIDSRADVIDEAIKLFDVCTCENCNVCDDSEVKDKCETDGILSYKEIVKKLKELKEPTKGGNNGAE